MSLLYHMEAFGIQMGKCFWITLHHVNRVISICKQNNVRKVSKQILYAIRSRLELFTYSEIIGKCMTNLKTQRKECNSKHQNKEALFNCTWFPFVLLIM